MSRERSDDLMARLQREATEWGGAPSAPTRAALRERIAELAAPRPRRLAPSARWMLAACAVAAALLAWRIAPVAAPGHAKAPVLVPAQALARATDVALQPLREEWNDLRQDGALLARELWQRVPVPLRQLVR